MGMGGKSGQLLLQFRGVAFRAFGFLLAQDDSFKLVAAFAAEIFKNRHGSQLPNFLPANPGLRLP